MPIDFLDADDKVTLPMILTALKQRGLINEVRDYKGHQIGQKKLEFRSR